MSQMWEVVHRLVAEEGLRLTPSRPADTCRANPPRLPQKSLPLCSRSPILD